MIHLSKAFSSFSVDDMQKAKEFYEGKLGIKTSESMHGIIDLDLNDNNHVMMYPKPNHEPASFTILNFPVDDVEQTVDELTAKGVAFEHYDFPQMKTDAKGIFRYENITQAWFKDPAGNILSVVNDGSQHSK
jgi:predicted enzyme related to lactoylglutathione lyase